MSTEAWRLPVGDEQRPTYFAHVIALTEMHGPGPLPRGGNPLPDSRPAARRPQMSEAVLDGVRTHHSRVTPDVPAAVALVDLIADLVAGPPAPEAVEHVHDFAAAQDMLPIADAVSRELAARGLPAERLRQVGRWLAENGTRRTAVALGLLLLGPTGDRRDRELLLLLGRLETLSLFAAVALARSQPDREEALFELAQRVSGWGRIHAVERLAGTSSPAIKTWLLRGGFRNDIMDEYLAHLAATTGDLAGALATPPVDDELLDSAGDILTALYFGGPAEDMTDYADAPVTIDRYLTLVAARPPSLARVAVVLRLARFLTSGWAVDLDARRRLQDSCERLVHRPDWRLTVEHALDSPDLPVFRQAIWPAQELDIPTRERIRARVRAHPDDSYLWQALTDDDIDDAVALARELLPLETLATGPTRGIGIDADPPHRTLDLIVSRLDEHPGKGWPLIEVALANPTVRNRNMAVRALTAWPSDAIPGHLVDALRKAGEIEPDPEIRDRMRRLLAGWTGEGEPLTPE
ncbi:hypothetical protein ACWEOE_13710 [Amycolatopsis sp. NPDC004368]